MFARGFLLILASAHGVAGCNPPRGDARDLRGDGTGTPALVDAPDRFYTRDGVTIRYRVIGAGDPVLLVHGYTDRVEMWAGTADSLARDFRVIVPDWRGFGLSTKLGDPADYGRKMVDDLAGLLEHLDVRATHAMGYSAGAVLVANLALDRPTLVRTATLVAGPFYADSVSAVRAFGAQIDSLATGHGLGPFFRFALPTWPDSAIAAILPALTAANDSASLLASIRSFPGLMIGPDRLGRASVPALAFVSVSDPMIEPTRYLARHWPGIKLVEIETHDHSDVFLAPALVNEFRRLVRR